MAVKSRRVTVGTDPTRLDTQKAFADGGAGSSLCFYNDGAQTIFVGDDEVTPTSGGPVPAGTWSPGVELGQGEHLHGCVAAATEDACVLETGV